MTTFYILTLLFIAQSGNSSAHNVTTITQEYQTLEKCQAAYSLIIKNFKKVSIQGACTHK